MDEDQVVLHLRACPLHEILTLADRQLPAVEDRLVAALHDQGLAGWRRGHAECRGPERVLNAVRERELSGPDAGTHSFAERARATRCRQLAGARLVTSTGVVAEKVAAGEVDRKPLRKER